MEEEYEGTIDLVFDDMPSIRLESFKPTHNAGMLQRLAIATKRRRFSLRDDWKIELKHIAYSDELTGTVEIPEKDDGEKSIVFDGASIPFPWLISLLTVGILRPLGVMLIGSIVHDYAYKYGSLRVSKNGQNFEDVSLPRHTADKLFRDIVSTVNRLPAVGYIAWFAVRLGWPWVKYNGKRFGGKIPFVEYALLALILFCAYYFISVLGFVPLLTILTCGYVLLYAFSLVIDKS